jgi:hypothetical protein
MARSNSSTSTRLIVAIVLSLAFFVAELVGETDQYFAVYTPSSNAHRSWLPYQIIGSDC